MPGRPRKVSLGRAGKEYGSGRNGMVMGETWMPLRAKSGSYWNTAVSLPSSSTTAPMARPQRCTEATVLMAGSVRAGGFAVLRPCAQLCTISLGANGLSSSPHCSPSRSEPAKSAGRQQRINALSVKQAVWGPADDATRRGFRVAAGSRRGGSALSNGWATRSRRGLTGPVQLIASKTRAPCSAISLAASRIWYAAYHQTWFCHRVL